jgi:hypothetical protein
MSSSSENKNKENNIFLDLPSLPSICLILSLNQCYVWITRKNLMIVVRSSDSDSDSDSDGDGSIAVIVV